MTEVNNEPHNISVVSGPVTPHDAQKLESKPSATANDPPSRMFLPVEKLDGFISHLSRLIYTRDGHDTLVLFLAYATQLTLSILKTPSSAVLQRPAIKLGQFVLRAFSSTKLPILSAPRLPSLLSAMPFSKLLLIERLEALLSMLNDWHTISRLWGLLTMWMLTKKFITNSVDYGPNEKNETKDLQAQKVKKTITAAQLMSLTGYFILENTTWLSMRGVLKWSKKSQSKFLGWCARCWCIYVIAELGRLLHERARCLPDGEDEDMKSRLEWKKKIVQVSVWLPLSIHYVSSSAVLPELVAAFLATYAEFITLKRQWDATAEKI